jgi:response regulator RpfG family c-di-GMP phosphodiesterase
MVISDILMPEMTGYELCHRIKANAETRDIPVILLTTLSNTTDVFESLAWEADSFISKPFNREYLLAHVAQTLENRSLTSRRRDRIELEIPYAGKVRLLSVEPQRLVSLLISSYEAAVGRNTELVKIQADLISLSKAQDDMLEQRTAALSAQVAEGKRREAELEAELAHLRTLIDNPPKKNLA